VALVVGMAGTTPRPEKNDEKPAKRNRTEHGRLLDELLGNFTFTSTDAENIVRGLLVKSTPTLTGFKTSSDEVRLKFLQFYDRQVQLRVLELAIEQVTVRVLNNVEVIASGATITMVNRRHVDVRGAVAWATLNVINSQDVTKLIILTGESGSGKTFSALMSCSALNGVAVLMVTGDFEEYLRCSGGTDMEREAAVMTDVRKFITTQINKKHKDIRVTLQDQDVAITLIVDEMDDDPKLVKAICCMRENIRRTVHDELTRSPMSKIRLIVAGSAVTHIGVVRFHGPAFVVMNIMAKAGGAWVALKQCPENAKLKEACEAEDPSPPVTALNVIATNSRCAALVARAFQAKSLWKARPGPLLDSQLWHLYHTAVYEFKLLNAFAKADADLCKRLFSRAFFLFLSGHAHDLSRQDRKLIAEFGILMDTAVPVVMDEPRVHWTQVSTADSDPNVGLFIARGTARYSMSPAAVQLGMSSFGWDDEDAGCDEEDDGSTMTSSDDGKFI
jgi:hypothetical protein